jgi:hypothetical protein
MFRTVTLGGYHKAEQGIRDRLCDTDDALAETVRNLTLKPCQEEEALLLAETLSRAWPSLSTLQTLRYALDTSLIVTPKIAMRFRTNSSSSWNTRIPMPQLLLNTLHSRPTVQLFVENTDRKSAMLDLPLLRSPNLYSLAYTVYYDDDGISEFSILRDTLLQSKALKHLSLYVKSVSRLQTPHGQPGPLNLQFEPGMRFPDLETLRLSYFHQYDLSREHCDMWSSCMNWHTLRSLDLQRGGPRYLFAALTNKIPQLKRLAFGFWPMHGYGPTWDCPDLDVIRRFLESIDGLEYVATCCLDDSIYRQIRPALLEKHGASLRELVSYYRYRNSWDVREVEKVCEAAPGLQVLSTSLSRQQEGSGTESRSRWVRCSSRVIRIANTDTFQPAEAAHTFSRLHDLRSLSVKVCLYQGADQPVPQLYRKGGKSFINERAARDTATALLLHLRCNTPKPVTEEVTVGFHAIYSSQMEWIFKATWGWSVEKQKYSVLLERKNDWT